MGKHKVTRAERRRAEREARKLLQSPRLFNEFLLAVRKEGLIGEEQNALLLFVVAVSRILDRPLNTFVKGGSSTGKNYLVTRILRLMPKSAVAEITSASDKAWNYSGSDFRHRVVYVQEQNEAAGTIDPIRLLISERKLIRMVPRWVKGKIITKRQVARGPVAAISTTTRHSLKIDDETRHISIWLDDSPEQTRQIAKSYTEQRERLSHEELRTWHMVHRRLAKRAGAEVTLPKWFEEIPNRLYVKDLRVRRYYPAFVEACRTVCLIRSFQKHRKLSKHGHLEVDFADFAITALIFDRAFVESLHLAKKGAAEETRQLVEAICVEKTKGAGAKDLARKLEISLDQAYSRLRYAAQRGAILRANRPERSNRKLFLPAPQPRFVPDPEKLFQKLKDLDEKVQFFHPITGERVVYRHEK